MIERFFNETINEIYNSVSSSFPDKYKPIAILAIFTLLIVLYVIFVWKFFKFLAKRDILNLNLRQYNTSEHPGAKKFLASLLFFLEYIVIIPVLVFFWFSAFSLCLLVIAEISNVHQIMLIAAAVVASTRILSYYSQDVSKELALYFPFILLSIAILEPGFFSVSELVGRFSAIPSLFQDILKYLVFIALVEILMRFIFLIFRGEDTDEAD